jgi:hypothetical protein
LLYYRGQFRDAEILALRTLQNSQNLPPVDQAILHKTLGFAYVAMGDNDKAKTQFTALLDLDPQAKLDSIYVSPKIISVFREAQTLWSQRQEQTKFGNSQELNLQLSALKRSLFFPGLGQLYRGQQTKGFSLFASEVALIGAVAYCQIRYSKVHDDYLTERDPAKIQDLYDSSNLYYRVRNGCAILAVGVYLYSLYDALFLPPKTEPHPPTFGLSVQPGTTTLRFTIALP